MIGTRGVICIFALLVFVSCCQAANLKSNKNAKEFSDEMLPWLLFARNGAAVSVATSGVCLLSMLSVGAVYLFSQYA